MGHTNYRKQCSVVVAATTEAVAIVFIVVSNYCGLTVKVLSLVTMETVNLSKSIPRNYGEFVPMIRRIG